ncbi:related to protein kinase PCTAIRE and related kinases [Ramularia collo-cygni]|uniref:cyclin-dependent kinase n=1 Tax=Ramularia collo-cygni TaxID=112498 RepID=A0A2D3VHV4_9PEZI|nr:related to protein kinase PCTAIRE and related kinases [Ramularia collo-cygni]CZT25730.1 related to protein kinase PCTAIRE and related kinases [Ramularia collo-cygni]
MADDWRGSITFSDRLDMTSQIGAAYAAANPHAFPTEASKYARVAESDIRKHASTLKEYNEQCDAIIQQLLASATPAPPIPDLHQDEHITSNLPITGGARIGRYTHAEHINDGITSEIFRAIDPNSPSPSSSLVALKITNPSMTTPPHDPIREARLLSQAKGPQIIPLLETFRQPDGHFVLAFPYLPHDLNSLLHSKSLTPPAWKTVLRDLFAGLAHIHSLGMIHRDIKPSNILLSSTTGPAMLADFGIAWSPTDSASEPADAKILDVGTTCYRPPELLFGQSKYGEKLDMWAAGCVAAQVICLNGKTLFDAGDLGSELALIKSIFETLGTPDEGVWPEAKDMPDWGKMHFVKYPGMAWEEILPGAEEYGVELVRNLVRFESGRRFAAVEAMEHPYLLV